MHSFTTITLFTTLSALTAAVPHARNHQHLHQARALHHAGDIVKREPVTTLQLSSYGLCGGDSGFECAPGSCCSEWGYCGTGDAYCGNGSGSASTSVPVYSVPAYTPSASSSTPASSAPSYVAPSSALAPSSTGTISTAGTGNGLGNVYKMYDGDGAASQGWPTMNDWSAFHDMWADNEDTINISCTEFSEANNSPQETADVKAAILSVGQSAGIDPRFILAIMMQESKGCVRTPTTEYSVKNPGLMQSDNGSGTCNSGTGAALNPCPASEITQMIKDGVMGTGPGTTSLVEALGNAGCNDVSRYYKAARIYNSGSIAADGNLGEGVATHCYSADIANRLTGWTTAECDCTLDG